MNRFAGLALLAGALVGGGAHAALLPATLNSSIYWGTDNLSPYKTSASPGTISMTFANGSFGTATMASQPIPALGVVATNPDVLHRVSANASELYYGIILGPSGVTLDVDFHVDIATGGTGPSAGSGSYYSSQAMLILTGNNFARQDFELCSGYCNYPHTGSELSGVIPLRIQTNQVFAVNMGVGCLVVNAVGTCATTIDPYFTLASTTPNPGLYSFEFSPGIGNTPPVPEPPASALAVIGLAALTLARHARRCLDRLRIRLPSRTAQPRIRAC